VCLAVPDAPVAFVHGLAGSAATTWRAAGWFDLLADAGRTVIGVDLPGHGSTPLPDGEIPPLERFVLDQLPDEPVAGVGFSLGAKALLLAAADEPHRFERLVVAGVGSNLFRREGLFDDFAGTMESAESAGPTSDDPVVAYFLDQAQRAGMAPGALVRVIRSEQRQVTTELLAAVTMPVLVVLGDRDFVGPADPLVDALPDAALLTLRGVDHFSTPKAFGFIDAALEFLGAAPA
jgi:pimeloyl-ACP methyl ester carboxylesterase